MQLKRLNILRKTYATDFTRIVVRLFWLFFIGANVKNIIYLMQSFYKKIIKIYNQKKPQELIHFQRID
jgi:hypothetical protein